MVENVIYPSCGFATIMNNNKIETVRLKELDFLMESFYKKRMQNTILIGEAGCGKTTLIESLACKMKTTHVFYNLNLTSSLYNTSYRGQFEEKIDKFLQDVIEFNKTSSRKIVLFIDEIHTIMKCGDTEGAISLANILKPYLSSGEITIIGATTTKEYNDIIKKDAAISRRLSPIKLKPLTYSDTINILRSFSENTLDDEIIKYCYDKSSEVEGTNPDKSIEIIDRCMARRKLRGSTINKKMVDEIVNYMKGDD